MAQLRPSKDQNPPSCSCSASLVVGELRLSRASSVRGEWGAEGRSQHCLSAKVDFEEKVSQVLRCPTPSTPQQQQPPPPCPRKDQRGGRLAPTYARSQSQGQTRKKERELTDSASAGQADRLFRRPQRPQSSQVVRRQEWDRRRNGGGVDEGCEERVGAQYWK